MSATQERDEVGLGTRENHGTRQGIAVTNGRVVEKADATVL